MAPGQTVCRRCARACALAVALGLGGCADTLQDRPIPHGTLETLLVAPFPVYWLGRSFHGLALTDATHDPGGAFTVQYGDCKQGGQGTCVPPLRVVTSPDNSFTPGASAPGRVAVVRGVPAWLTRGAQGIAFATAGVVVSIFASDRTLAAAAAQTTVPINEAAAPATALPAPLPDTGFGRRPLPAQMASPIGPR